eukprot:TRINITY_DN28183_c0_g1_i1.p3 TRINITY_DN28183_c0_g1~~TRINITY_DN28183_c0_g1_i1.p3  ORF type:complete len:126 (-),score=29.24 TRINITY_DN28183_c0_g1_i1:365-742(-)
MASDKDWRFYVANIAATALLVNGISYLARGSKSKDKSEGEEEKASCPFSCKGLFQEHDFATACGVVSVAGAVCMQDRLPYAGAAGALASVLPFAHSETRSSACPLTTAVSLAACGYLFYSKSGRF